MSALPEAETRRTNKVNLGSVVGLPKPYSLSSLVASIRPACAPSPTDKCLQSLGFSKFSDGNVSIPVELIFLAHRTRTVAQIP